MENNYDNKTYSYGKRPLWQWLVIYAIIGLVVYGIIYYIIVFQRGVRYNPTIPPTIIIKPTIIITQPPAY